MLLSNIENPLQPPRDPSCCPPQISQQINSNTNSNSTSDGRISCSDDVDGDVDQNKQLHLVDLCNSDHHPPPNFCIRDYVFNTRRSKDIENNWPFSAENLHLCLKHGLKDLLPPFQPPDTVRNPSSLCNFKSQTQDDHGVFVDYSHSDIVAGCSNQSIAARDCLATNPKGFEFEGGDKEFPSTITTSQTCSDINSVPTNRCPEFGTDNFQELSPPPAKKPKVVNRTQAQLKKSRLVVKLGNNSSNLTAKEDGLMVSEAAAMASSKVCPVCKTFSSSSNTTLNAHIDQCLAGESTTTKWSSNSTSDSKVIKHKIKPRKIKSMVEIYVTALHCTLEELDRRNGTNWANPNSTFPAKENEGGCSSADQKKKQGGWSLSPADSLEETPPDEGAVYIDASGTKVRILSKSTDPSPVSKAVDGDKVPPKKPVNRDKVRRFLFSKKKKQNQVQKRHKLMKHGKMISTSWPHRAPSEINDKQDRNFHGEESLEKEEARVTRHFKPPNEVKFSRRPDKVLGWVSSKRTGLTKKCNGIDNRDLSLENDRSFKGSCNVRNSCTSGKRISDIFENSIPSPGSSEQAEKFAYDSHDDEDKERTSVRKASVESQVSFDKERVCKFKQSRKDKAHNGEDRVSFVCKRSGQVYADEDRNIDHPVIDPENSNCQNAPLFKGKICSSSRNKSSSGPGSKLGFKRKHSAFKNSSGVGYSSKSNEDYLKHNYGFDCDRMERPRDIVTVDGTSILKPRKRRGEDVNARKVDSWELKTSQSGFMSYDDEDQDGSFMDGSASRSRSHNVESAGTNDDTSDDEQFDMEPPSSDAFMNLSNPLASSSERGCNSGRFSDEAPDFEDPACSAEPMFNAGPKIFCASSEVVPENINVVAEMESSGTHGNYFVDVDPIPIPGPPGSFLPSPGRMDSECLPGNSSLTSSRIQSSDDRPEFVDQSSDSPVSAISAISNSTLAKSDSKSSRTMLAGSPGQVLDALGNSIVDSSPLVLLESTSTACGSERTVLDKYHEISLSSNENVVPQFKDHHPPCCCCRKEGFSRSISLNYEESQLLRRRTMPPTEVLAATRKETTCDQPETLSANGCVSGGNAVIQRIAADSSLVKFPSVDASCELNSPATPSPVLRLMGKNLMVVNKDDQSVVSSQIKASQFSSIIGHENAGYVLPVSGVPVVTQEPPRSLELASRSNNVMQCSELSDGYHANHENAWTPSQMLPVISPAKLSSRGPVACLAGSSSMHHEYIHGYNMPSSEQRQPVLNGMGKPSVNYDANEQCRSPPSLLGWRNAANCTSVNNAAKEIIVIDDSPENDQMDSMPAPTVRNQGTMQGVNLACGARPHAFSLYGYPQYDSAATFCTGSPVDASFRMQSNNVVNVNGSNPAKWMNWAAAEGSSPMHQNPLMRTTSPTAAAHLRPKFYTYSTLK